MTDDKYKDHPKNDMLEMLPLESNLMFVNSSFNFFESTAKRVKSDSQEDKDILIVNTKKNLSKNFQNAALGTS